MEDSLYDILLDAGLSEQDIEDILSQMSILPGQSNLARTQYEQAQALRRTPTPTGQWTGRVYTRAHPLEHVAAGVDRVVGGIEARKQMERQNQILEQQGRLRGLLFSNMLKQGRQNPPATGSMSPISPGMGSPMSEALRRIDPYQLR